MLLKLNFPLLGLDGAPIEGSDVGRVLAHELAGASQGDSIKFYGWAVKLWAGESIYLDASDRQALLEFTRGRESLKNLAKAQILGALLSLDPGTSPNNVVCLDQRPPE